MAERLVVVGGDAAGMSAASQARRMRGPDDLEIVAFERGNHTSYSACGIPYWIGGVVEDPATLIARDPETFRDKHSIDARIRHEVTEIDLDKCAVKVRTLDGGRDFWDGYDILMVATGAQPIRPSLPGVDATNIFGVQVLGDGMAIREALEKSHARKAVVVGAGYIGIEMAEAFVRRGLDVTVIELGPQPMGTLDPDMGSLVADAMREMGMSVLTEEPVEGFESEGGALSAVVTGERTVPADIVILGLGVRPNVDLSQAAGIPLGEAGGIAVDPRMRTGIDGVFAAGDCVEKMDRITKRAVTIPLGTHANKEGRTAGINIGGGHATFPGVVGTAASKVCSLEVGRTGVKESEAHDAGLEIETVTVESTTRAGYFPGAESIKTKLIVERPSGRLLGAQIVGREGAAKRIDVLAATLWSGLGVEEILNLDLSYAPPFSPVWDPVLIAARKAWQKVQETR